MDRRSIAITIALGLVLLLSGCNGEATLEIPPAPPLDQMPLVLARPLFQAGYELVSYRELDVGGDGITEALAVLTSRLPLTESFLGDSYVLLFGQHGGMWSLHDGRVLDGINARAELRDLTGDGFPELLVSTEEADAQLGDFVTPLRYTDHLVVFTYTPDLYLVELGKFSSSLAGVMRSQSTVREWGGQPAIQTVQDLPPAGIPLWWPTRTEVFAWNGWDFASVQVREQRRISPVFSWLVRQNGAWAVAFLILGGALSAGLTAVARRLGLRERWIIVGLALLLVAGGVGLWLREEWVCVPALILVGLAGLGIGQQVMNWLVAKSGQDTEMGRGE